jgi:hypothetical protein
MSVVVAEIVFMGIVGVLVGAVLFVLAVIWTGNGD